MKIELRPLDRIKPYESNPRVNDPAVQAVAASIQEFGFRQPIVVDGQGVIIVGHTRWKAARQLGLEKVPVHVATGLTEAQVKAYRIADNQTSTLSTWDNDLLVAELLALKDVDYDLDLVGFTPEDLARLFNGNSGEGLCDPDEVPDPPDEAVTRPGDLIIFGDSRTGKGHRLLCGDSAKVEDVDRLLEGEPIHLLNSDPPYNVRVEPRSNNAIAAGNSSFKASGNKRTHHQSFDVARQGEKQATHTKLRAKDRPLENDFVSGEAFDEMLLAWFGNASRVLKPGGSFYIWGGYANLGNYPGPLRKSGLYFSQGIVWDKEHPVLTRKDFMGAFEICFYGWKEGAGHRFYGPNNATDLWHLKKVNPQSMVHLTEKPVELAARAMQYSSKPGEHVLDLFGGSGSTLIAAEQTGRRAFLMEIDPLYCDVIVQRYEKFTGGQVRRVQLETV